MTEVLGPTDRSGVESHEAAGTSEDFDDDSELDEYVESSVARPHDESRPNVQSQVDDNSRSVADEDDEDHAPSTTFAIRNPFQGYDSVSIYVALGVVFSAFAIRLARKCLRGDGKRNRRGREEAAFSWRSSNCAPKTPSTDPSRPILGNKLVVSEKCVPRDASILLVG